MKILDAKQANSLQGGPTFSLGNRLTRAIWILAWLVLASWTPRQAHPWRRFLLRLFGAQMADGSDVRGSARVWYPPNLVMHERAVIGPDVNCYNMGRIVIGRSALVSQGVHLCAGTHDYDDPDFQLQVRPIEIGAHAWVAAEAFIAPGAVIGEGAVVGARAVAFGRIPPWTVYSGNPARKIKERRRPSA
ncbi:MAG: putative colanic acid biosynthesis acetyltransferase [Burkholderiaceae bacterium]